jgi:hypothetical protein
MAYRFKPSRAQKDAYIEKIEALNSWISGEGREFHAEKAFTGTVYFTIAGQRYRVSSHKPGINYDGEVTFHAAPTRAPEIAAALLAGNTVNGRGVVA